MEQFLIEYGLLAIFLCAVVENDVTFILAGVIVHLGIVEAVPALLAGLGGALVHDSIWFWLGHARAETVRSHRVYRRLGPAVERLAAQFGPWELFFCRFVFGTRTPSLVFWGVQHLPVRKFLLIEGLALSLWGSVLVAVGFFLSNSAALIIGRVKSFEHWMLGAFLLAGAGFLVTRLLTRHEIKKRLMLRRPSDSTER